MTREALGEFEHHVLLAVVRSGGRAYSAPVVMELESMTGRSVSAAAVFVALRRLEQRGFVESTKREPAPGEGGRGRRMFRITEAALTRLRESRRHFEQLWSGVDELALDG